MRFEVINSKTSSKTLVCLERIGKLYTECETKIVNTPICSLYLSTGKTFKPKI